MIFSHIIILTRLRHALNGQSSQESIFPVISMSDNKTKKPTQPPALNKKKKPIKQINKAGQVNIWYS